MEMTPEERAKDLFHELLTSRTMRGGREADDERAFGIIASVIRAAENDALERAAALVENSSPYDLSREARDIRALKT
jgi:hypothetical protein